MTRSDFQHTMRSIDQLNKDLDRLLKDLQGLSRHLGQELGSVMETGVTQRLRAAQGVLESFLRLASAMQTRVGEVAARVPGVARPQPPAAKPKRKAARKAAPRAGAPAAKSPRSAAPRAGTAKKRAGGKLTPARAHRAVAAAGGVKTKAAKQLGVSVPTLNKYLKLAPA